MFGIQYVTPFLFFQVLIALWVFFMYEVPYTIWVFFMYKASYMYFAMAKSEMIEVQRIVIFNS